MFSSNLEVQQRFDAQDYICTQETATVVYLAMQLQKPLLIEGPACGRNCPVGYGGQCHRSLGHGHMVINEVPVGETILQHPFIGSGTDKHVLQKEIGVPQLTWKICLFQWTHLCQGLQ